MSNRRVIDFHTHFLGGVYTKAVSYPKTFMAEMDENNIETSLLLPNDGFFSGYKQDNNKIIQWVDEYPGRFQGLGTVDPRDKEAIPELIKCVKDGGLIGMKLHPWLQSFCPLDDMFMPFCEEANSLKTMLFFHDGTPPYSEPYQISQLAKLFPDIIIVLGHSGLNDLWQEALDAAKRLDNVWLCICGGPYHAINRMAMELNGEKMVWGSDYPLANLIDTRMRISHVENIQCSDDVKEKILYRNANELIKLLRGRNAV